MPVTVTSFDSRPNPSPHRSDALLATAFAEPHWWQYCSSSMYWAKPVVIIRLIFIKLFPLLYWAVYPSVTGTEDTPKGRGIGLSFYSLKRCFSMKKMSSWFCYSNIACHKPNVSKEKSTWTVRGALKGHTLKYRQWSHTRLLNGRSM